MKNYTGIIEIVFPILDLLLIVSIAVLLGLAVRNLKKASNNLNLVLARTASPNILSLDESMNILEIHINSAIIELRLAYKNKEAELAVEMDEVIKARTTDLLNNLSQRHLESLESYMSRKFIILFVSRNIREHVLDIVVKK